MLKKQDISLNKYLLTERLILRAPNLGDTKTIFFMRTDVTLNQYIKRSPPKTLQEVEAFIEERLKDRKEGKAIYWVIAQKDLPVRCIGAISLWQFSEDRKTAEVGYDLHPDYQGKSIMSEALQAVVGFGKQDLALDRIEAYTHKENKASIRLLQRNQFFLTDKSDSAVPTNRVYAIETRITR
jgi:ribosomal-protein-alanine N-acetyltransferase